MNQRLLRLMSTLALLVVFATALVACGGGSDASLGGPGGSAGPTPVAKEVLADEQAGTPVDSRIVDADNGLGLSLLNLLDQNATGNVAISPTSIALAFEMLYNGAAGATQQGMSEALELGSFTSAQDVDAANASLQAALMDADPNVTITIANSLWMHLAASTVLPSFTQVNQDCYAAEVGDLEGAPADVNDWVSQATQGLITQLLPPGDYSSLTLVLANAIYNIFVSDVVHETVVEVDETGTTAAAATGIGESPTVVGPTATIVMNRPFFYAIRDDDNGALLFVGLLMNPSAS